MAFQGWWIYNSYQIEKEQLYEEVNNALHKAVNYEVSRRYKPFTKQLKKAILTGSDLIDSRLGDLVEKIPEEKDSLSSIDTSISISVVSIDDSVGARQSDFSFKSVIGGIENEGLLHTIFNNLLGNQTVNREILDSTFQAELSKREIDLAYQLEYEEDKSTEVKLVDEKNDILATECLTFDLNDKHCVKANILFPSIHILWNMSALLSASLLLILISSIAYVYMLMTILHQKKISEVKNDFINNMTHELKTPIATVSAAVEALQNFGAMENPEKAQLYLKTSRQELNRLSGLVTKVLNIAINEKQGVNLNKEKINLSDMLSAIVENQSLRTDKPLNITFEDGLKGQFISGDRVHLTNVIINLIDNAIKYSHSSVEILLSGYLENEKVILSIKDNGIGIGKNNTNKIFDKFYRIPTGNQHNVKGFGLGLSYVKDIMIMHLGTIHVKSTKDAGSEFILSIPI